MDVQPAPVESSAAAAPARLSVSEFWSALYDGFYAADSESNLEIADLMDDGSFYQEAGHEPYHVIYRVGFVTAQALLVHRGIVTLESATETINAVIDDIGIAGPL